MSKFREQADVLEGYVREVIGDSPAEWPGGWPGEIEAALIDAVFSIRASYGNREKKTGVYGAVTRWREHRGGTADDLSVLASTDPEVLEQHTNKWRASQRSKAEIVIDAARALVDVGVVHAADLDSRQDEARRAYRSIKGCGPITWRYFRMLLGLDDAKPDIWVMRFIQDRLPDVKSTEVARDLLAEVSRRMGIEMRQLDHAIWLYRRGL